MNSRESARARSSTGSTISRRSVVKSRPQPATPKGEVTRAEVLRRNAAERLKQEKAPWQMEAELPRLARLTARALSEDDLRRLEWQGVYHDRPKQGLFMVRIKAPNGVLTPPRLRMLGELAVRYGHNRVEITTRQTVQIHGLRLRVIPKVLEVLGSAGLSGRGGGGDVTRNVTGCPVAGLDPEEWFDPTPVVAEALRQIVENPAYGDLPHLHRLSISACRSHCCAPELQDTSLVGVIQKGQPGFAVWVGGSGAAPARLAESLGVFVTTDEAVEVVQAILDIWRSDLHYRVSRSRARLKFMVEDLGLAGFRKRVEAHLGRRLTNLTENPKPLERTSHLGLHPQKQKGLYYVGFPVVSGLISGDQLLRVAELTAAHGAEARLSREQNLIIADVPKSSVDRFVKQMADKAQLSVTGHPLGGQSIACCGSPHCNDFKAETKRKLAEVVGHLEHQFGAEVNNLRIYMSGCSHGCGQHLVGDIGLLGSQSTAAGGEAYDIVVGGGLGAEAQLGQGVVRRVPAAQLKYSLERLVRTYLSQRRNGESAQHFFCQLPVADLTALVRKPSGTRPAKRQSSLKSSPASRPSKTKRRTLK